MTTFAKAITAAAALAALASHPVAAGDLTLGAEGAGFQLLRAPPAAIDEPLLRSLAPLSDTELDAVEGRAFPFRFRFDITIVPQINICLFCSGVSQSNQVYVFRLFERP